MAYLDILPSTNLKAVDIRDTIGSQSNNLSHYCCRAKSGGSGGYAFNIIESGGTPNDGELIGVPYFNIYSNEAPGEWTLSSSTSLIYKLKRNIYGTITVDGNTFTSSSYCFDLGTFRGYRHASVAPYPSSNSKVQAVGSSSTGYEVWIGNIFPGDYDWAKIAVAQGASRSDLYYSLLVLNRTNNSSADIPHVEGETMIHVDNVSGGVSITYNGVPPSTSANLEIKLAMFKKNAGGNFALQYYIPIETSATGNGGGSSIDIDVELESGFVQPYVDDIVLLQSEDGIHYNYQTVTEIESSAGRDITFTATIEMMDNVSRFFNGYIEHDGGKIDVDVQAKNMGLSGDYYVYEVAGSVDLAYVDDIQGALVVYIYP